MRHELNSNELIYKVDMPKTKNDNFDYCIPDYDCLLDKIKSELEINQWGYNIYLVDNYSKEKITVLKDYIQNFYRDKSVKDICYIVKEDEKAPVPIMITSGRGIELKKELEDLQNYYLDAIYNFYNNSHKEKEQIIKEIQKKRNERVSYLFELAKSEGFEVRPTSNGFTFAPIKEEDTAVERDYEALDINVKEDVLNKVSELKQKAHIILEEIKVDELEGVQKIKEIMLKYLVEEMSTEKSKSYNKFEFEEEAFDFLRYVCENIERKIVDIYSTSYEDDEEKIAEIIYKYDINVLVDNSEYHYPKIIFEEDPTISNLIGSIEYENRNGNFVTDVSLLKAGSLLQANGGCIILRANSLFANPQSYLYLKKTLMSGKLKFDYNRSYIDLLSISAFRPEAIDINVKVILIGDYETYDVLYNLEEDFKSIFKIRLEYDSIIANNSVNNRVLINNIKRIITNNKLTNFDDNAVKEVFRYLSRKAESKNKIFYDDIELNKIIYKVDNYVKSHSKSIVKYDDVIKILYQRDTIEKHLLENYEDNKILFMTEDRIIGSVNGLSVVDTGYLSFGRPIRITCSCYKGDGNIIDVQKESNLSGSIHNKSINILKGLLNRLFGGYNSLPVDFHISFEQIYGKIEGDSASVAEVISMISALCKVPIRQNIAITGSINQFGEVQAVGGINDKIEGFYNICKLKGGTRGKGVLIPKSNVNNIILNPQIEEAVVKGNFHIYTMEILEDAVDVLMGDERTSAEEIINLATKEIKKYNTRSRG